MGLGSALAESFRRVLGRLYVFFVSRPCASSFFLFEILPSSVPGGGGPSSSRFPALNGAPQGKGPSCGAFTVANACCALGDTNKDIVSVGNLKVV